MDSPFPADCARRFIPEERIGSGGFGSVWKAIQRDLGRPVAIKLLKGPTRDDPTTIARFENEARITASLSHPHIVVIIDHGAEAGVPWIAYEYSAGESLRDRLARGPVSWPEALQICIQVAHALEEAHARGIYHRDIKPDNILEHAPGFYKVADFGIAHWQQQASPLTAAGTIIGSPAYLDPALIEGGPPGPQGDLYALGITLFELLTGSPPFTHDNPVELLRLHLEQALPRVRDRVPDVPAGVEALIDRVLSKNHQERLSEARSFRLALEALSAPGTLARTVQAVVPPSLRKNAATALLSPPPRSSYRPGAILLVLLGLLAIRFWPARQPPLSDLLKLQQMAMDEEPERTHLASRELLKKFPHCARVHLWNAHAYALEGQLDQADREFALATADDPDDPLIPYTQYWPLRRLAGYRRAAALMETTSRRFPHSVVAQNCRSLVLWDRGKYGEALKNRHGAPTDDPGAAGLTYLHDGHLYLYEKQLDAALESYKRASRLLPGCVSIHNRLANVYQERGDWLGAIDSSRNALRSCGTDRMTRVRSIAIEDLVKALLHVGNSLEAMEVLERTCRTDPSATHFQAWRERLSFLDWKKCERLLPRLKSNKVKSDGAIQELQKLTPVNLGPQRDYWIAWIELGQWLERWKKAPVPGPLPTSIVTAGTKTRPDVLEETINAKTWSMLREARSGEEPAFLAGALADILRQAEDGPPWLLLGTLLHRQGLLAEARLLLAEGLKRFPTTELRSKLQLHHEGLIWALLEVPGHDLEKEWPAWIARIPRTDDPSWDALQTTLATSRPALYRRLLTWGTRANPPIQGAFIYLGNLLVSTDRDHLAAEAVLMEGLRKFPTSSALTTRLTHFVLEQGRLADAKKLLDSFSSLEGSYFVLKAVRGVDPRQLPPPALKDPHLDLRRRLWVQLLLEWGDWKGAEEAYLEYYVKQYPECAPVLMMELMATGCSLPPLVRYATPYLNELFLALCTDGFRTDPSWITRAENFFRPFQGSVDSYTIYHALWLSRRGRIAESLQALKSFLEVISPPHNTFPFVAEVLARPRWSALLRPAARLNPGPLLEIPQDALPKGAGEYLALLDRRDFVGAEQIAKSEYLNDPNSSFWRLALACLAVRDGETPKAKEQIEALRISARMTGDLWLLRRLAKPYGAGSTLLP
jgi:serine/threonine protein kinase/Tfp pilus assembly protein PilF